MIDFAVNFYAEVAAPGVYPDHPELRDWTANGYMMAWRDHFPKDPEGGEHVEEAL